MDVGEAAAVGGAEVLELRERLVGKVVTVDQEEDPGEATVLEQPVGLGDRGVGLARAGGHLHEAAVKRHSTPDSGVPTGLASMTPTARWST